MIHRYLADRYMPGCSLSYREFMFGTSSLLTLAYYNLSSFAQGFVSILCGSLRKIDSGTLFTLLMTEACKDPSLYLGL